MEKIKMKKYLKKIIKNNKNKLKRGWLSSNHQLLIRALIFYDNKS